MNIKSVLRIGILMLLPIGQANALILDNWNDAGLDASGDYIAVNSGEDGGNTWFSMTWMAGGDNILDPLGIDQVYYNYYTASASGDITAVFLGATDVSDNWDDPGFNFGGTTAGGGFGDFTSHKTTDGGGTDGIDPYTLIFLLDGLVTFADNGDPTNSTFAAHVRYNEGCSGWVSDGTTSSSEDSGSCGGNNVPEPDMLGLLAIGLLGTFVARRRMKV